MYIIRYLTSFALLSLLHFSSIAEQSRGAKIELLDRPASVMPKPSSALYLSIARVGKRIVAVGEAGLVVISDDDGKTWHQSPVPVSVTLTSVCFVGEKQGWVTGHGGVVLRTTDGGESWTRVADGVMLAKVEVEAASATTLPKRIADAKRLLEEGADKPLLSVYFVDEKNGWVAGAYGLFFSTNDGGNTWQSAIGRINNRKAKHLYSLRRVGSRIYIAGEQGALYRSDEQGEIFNELPISYRGTFFDVVGASDGSVIALGLRGNVFRSLDGSGSWNKVEVGQNSSLTAAIREKDGAILMSDETGRILRSTDHGASFIPLSLQSSSSLTGLIEAADGAIISIGARGIIRTLSMTKVSEKN